jgi:cytochrome b561
MHWLMAPALTGSVACVLYAQTVPMPEKGKWMFRHKSLGLLTGMLAVPRLAVKLASKAPEALKKSHAIEQLAAKVSHVALYGFLLVMPASGIAMGYFGGKGLPFFFTTFPGAETPNGAVAKQSFSIHKTLGTYGKFLLPVHVGAAGMHAARGHGIFSRISPLAPK